MSAATDLANEEADRVEAELGPDEELSADDETATDAESEEEADPEAEAAPVADPMEGIKKLQASEKAHRTRVQTIMGADFAEAIPCPLCSIFTAGFFLHGDGLQLPPEVKDAIRQAIGDAAAPELQPAKDSEQCPDCDGWGDVLTGSKADRAKTGPCIRCNGKGYVAKVYIRAAEAPQAEPYPGSADPPVNPPPGGNPDGYGRPAGHRHWGVDPATLP